MTVEKMDGRTGGNDASVSDVFSQIGEDVGQSLRREFDQLRAEAGERARAGARGAGLLTAAGFSGSVAVAAASVIPLLALRRIIGPVGTSVVVAGATGAAAGFLAKRGLDELGVDTEHAADRAKGAVRQVISQ